jgi:hypothetical protein
LNRSPYSRQGVYAFCWRTEDNLSTSRIKYFGVALATLGAIMTIGGVVALKSLPRIARRILIADLQERFHSTIEIGEIQVRGVVPVKIVARDITLRYHGRNDVPPLMAIEQVTGSAGLRGLWSGKWRVTSLHLDGLQIRIPPDEDKSEQNGERTYLVPRAFPKLRLPPVEFDEVTADNALLQILPRQKDRKPHSFWIHHLTLRSVHRREPAYFHAQLTNEIPTGEIDSEGTFGPWNGDQPSLTPVSANFGFANANLGQFRGLSGTLSSTGHYGGVLERLEVEGEARVPDFGLSLSGKTVALITHYVAVVDGRNGNTDLKSVEAHFLQTALQVKGEIVDPPGTPLRKIVLHVTTSDARVEDLLRLVTKGTSVPVAGAVKLEAQFELPSGSSDVVDRLSIRGQFEIARAGFTNRETQGRIDALSRRGQGKPGNEGISDVPSDVRGSLLVGEAQAHFSKLEFTVPGACVSLKGSYGLRTEAIDLHGQIQLSSKLSHTTKGVNSVLLRVLDPFFKDGAGGSVLPIKITGFRSNPSFGLELRKHAKPA